MLKKTTKLSNFFRKATNGHSCQASPANGEALNMIGGFKGYNQFMLINWQLNNLLLNNLT